MAITKIKLNQLVSSATPGSLLQTDGSNVLTYLAPTTGINHLMYYKTSTAQWTPLTLGTNLTFNTTTNEIDATAGAGGYATAQDEGSTVGGGNTTLNFIGSGITAANAGGGVTSITMAAFLNTLATAGNVNLTSAVAGVLPVANGGTNLSSGTSGGVLGFTAAGTIASSGLLTDNVIMLGGGVGATPTSLAAGLGTTTTVLHGNAAGEPTWSAVSLTADVTGVLATANGGTGTGTYVVGDLLYASSTSTLSRLADVATGSVLKSGGIGTAPLWGTLASTDLSNTANIALLSANQTFAGNNTFSNNITMNGTPSASTDVVTVGYVTNIVANGLKFHSVRGASTGALTISGRTTTTLTVGGTSFVQDGVTFANGEYYLLKDNATGAGGGSFDNGAYTVSGVGSSILLTRAAYMDTAAEIDGHTFIIEDGTVNVGTIYATVSEVTTLGTDAIVFTQIQTSGSVTGTGANNQISVWSGTNSQDGNSTFTWDQTQMTVGTATPVASSRVTTQGTGTTSATFGLTHNNSSAAKVFSIADDGSLHVGVSGSRLSISNTYISNSTQNITLAGTGTVTFQSGGTAHTGSQVIGDTGIRQITSGTTDNLQLLGTFSPTSGTATNAQLWINNTINQSGGANGITRGIWVVPTLTAASDFRAVEVTANASHYALWTTAGKVRFDLGSDANFDMFTRSSTGILQRVANGTTGQFLGANTGAAPTWQTPAGGTITRAYLTGSTSSVIDLDSGTAVTDVDGGNIAFSVPTDLDKTFVVRNGVTLSRSGTVSRDYTLVSATGVLTLASALTTDESLMVYKIV